MSYLMPKIQAATWVVLLLNAPALSSPQTSSPTGTQSNQDAESGVRTVRHDEVTVTATRNPTPMRQLGQAVTVITAADIEAQGARTVQQVLETVPGFSVVRTGSFGGTTSVFVRGGESDYNLVLIDGVRANQAGGSFDFANLTTANIERIEIVRGPSSVLYGSQAVTSTINIITRQGADEPTGNLAVEGGSHGTALVRGGIAGQANRLHYSLGGQFSDTDGAFELNSDYRNTSLSGAATIDLTSASFVSTTVRFLDSEAGQPTDGSGAVVDPNDLQDTQQTSVSVAYQNQVNGRYGTRVQYGFHRRDFVSETISDGIVDFFDSTFRSEERRHQIDWKNNFQLGPDNLLTAGLGWEREESLVDSVNRRSIGFYVQDQLNFDDRLFVTAGLRFDDNNRYENFTTATLSAALMLDEQWKLRASFGNGFRAPTFSEINGFPDFGIIGNSQLDPEKNVATDFGVDFVDRQGRWTLAATAFFNNFSDLIEFTFFAPAGEPNFVNVEEAVSRGLELDGFVAPTNSIRLGGQYTFTHTEVTDAGDIPGGSIAQGESLLRRPRSLAGIYAEYRQRRYRLRVDFKFKGQRDDFRFFPDFSSERVTLPSYWKVDLGVTLPIVNWGDSSDLAFTVRGENIFNRQYQEVAGFDSVGRSLFAGLEVAF